MTIKRVIRSSFGRRAGDAGDARLREVQVIAKQAIQRAAVAECTRDRRNRRIVIDGQRGPRRTCMLEPGDNVVDEVGAERSLRWRPGSRASPDVTSPPRVKHVP